MPPSNPPGSFSSMPKGPFLESPHNTDILTGEPGTRASHLRSAAGTVISCLPFAIFFVASSFPISLHSLVVLAPSNSSYQKRRHVVWSRGGLVQVGDARLPASRISLSLLTLATRHPIPISMYPHRLDVATCISSATGPRPVIGWLLIGCDCSVVVGTTQALSDGHARSIRGQTFRDRCANAPRTA